MGAVSALALLSQSVSQSSLCFLRFFPIVATPVASHWSPVYCTPSFFGVFPYPTRTTNTVPLILFYISFLRSVFLSLPIIKAKAHFFSLSFWFLFSVLSFLQTTSGVQLKEQGSTKPNTTPSLIFEPEAYSRYLFPPYFSFSFYYYKPSD